MTAPKQADVIIVGGGLQGCATALELSRAGCSVIVLEQDFVGRHASGVNAGGVRRLSRDPAEIPLAMEALTLWQRMPERVGDDCGFVPSGQVKIAETPSEMETLVQRAEMVRGLGYDHEEIIDQKELKRWVPAAAHHCVGGLLCRGDGFAEPFKASRAYKAAAERTGARVLEQTAVRTVEPTAGGFKIVAQNRRVRTQFQSPVFVNCAGAWADRLAAMTGDRVLLKPTAFTMMVTARRPRFIEPVVGLAARKLSFKQALNGTVVIGGGYISHLDFKAKRTEIDFAGMQKSARTVLEVFPVMQQTPVVRCWAGIEGVTPDGLPMIGPSRTPGAFHAFGFSAHGFQLFPVVGKIMADLVIKGKTQRPIAPFRVDRFPDDATFKSYETAVLT